MVTKAILLALLGLDVLAFFALKAAGVEGLFAMCLSLLGSHVAVSVLLMRLLIWLFPVREGEFEEGTPEVDRWQARAVVGCLSCNLFDPMVPIFLRAQWYMLFGARLAWTAHVAGRILDCSLVEMKPGSLLGQDGLIAAHFQVGRRVRIGRVEIAEGATVGIRATVFPGVRVGEGATVGAHALVLSGKGVPAGETWAGVPAKRIKGMPNAECRMPNGEEGGLEPHPDLGEQRRGWLVDA